MSYNIDQAEEKDMKERKLRSDLTDIYICVFFDGTANNMYEQKNKSDAYKKTHSDNGNSSMLHSVSPVLFTINKAEKYYKEQYEQLEFGMKNYEEQKSQAEQEHVISNQRTKAEDNEHNGGWKYSNVAVLRSITRKKNAKDTSSPKGEKVIGDTYNLYIEGSGAKWETGSEKIGLGMGTGRTGVVGLVSKAMVFIQNRLSYIEKERRKDVKVHFAIFGFSRGSTCGRLLSYMIASSSSEVNTLPKKDEFEQYLPKSMWQNKSIRFLDDFDKAGKVTVDFLGIYDTVSSIGFLLKDNPDTDAGMNQFKKIEHNGEDKYVNILHGGFQLSDAHNTFHCDNAREYGLYSPQLTNVKHTFHVCAMDEYRENFALVDLGDNIKEHGNCTEVFMPGCHSDIGGGYTFEDEIDRYTLRRIVGGKVTTLISTADPKGGTPTPPLSQDVLLSLGWLDRTAEVKSAFLTGKEKAKGKYAIEGEQTIKTDGQTTYIYQNPNKIEFERHAKEGYSNISLEMMRKRACSDSGVGLKDLWPSCFLPFEVSLPLRFQVPDDPILNDIVNQSQQTFSEGDRHWIIPELSNYVTVRRRFLHWTCTDELNLEKGHWTASGANIGNPPNWRNMGSHYLLCRIIYHGDRADSDLHYMTDY